MKLTGIYYGSRQISSAWLGTKRIMIVGGDIYGISDDGITLCDLTAGRAIINIKYANINDGAILSDIAVPSRLTATANKTVESIVIGHAADGSALADKSGIYVGAIVVGDASKGSSLEAKQGVAVNGLVFGNGSEGSASESLQKTSTHVILFGDVVESFKSNSVWGVSADGFISDGYAEPFKTPTQVNGDAVDGIEFEESAVGACGGVWSYYDSVDETELHLLQTYDAELVADTLDIT